MQKLKPELIKSLSEKSDKELVGILESPDYWQPEVVEFARAELARRSAPVEQIESKIAEKARMDTEELQKKAQVPLASGDVVWTVINGIIGLAGPGFFCQYWLASGFKNEGYLLKSKRSWRLFWLVFAIGFIVAVVFKTLLTELSFRGATGKQ